MNELYEMIEKKIRESGYPREISGMDVYDDICDQMEGKDDEFNLGILTMRTPEGVFETNFDE